MPTPAPIVLHLYDPETSEVVDTKTANFIPWKMLKRGIQLQKQIGDKNENEYAEEDIDAMTNYIMQVFPKGLTVEMLDQQADIVEMMSVITSIVRRARGVMDPTLPPAA